MMLEPKDFQTENLNGIYSEIAAILGPEAVLKLHENFRGQQVFFPVELFSKEYVWQRIVEEYDGANAKQIAIKYGYTERWVKKILREHLNVVAKKK